MINSRISLGNQPVYDKFIGNAFITASNKDCPGSPSKVKRGIGGVNLFGIITHFLEVTPSIPAYRTGRPLNLRGKLT